jgi:hypothetical protein
MSQETEEEFSQDKSEKFYSNTVSTEKRLKTMAQSFV